MTVTVSAGQLARFGVAVFGVLLAVGGWFLLPAMEDAAERAMNFARADALAAYGWLGQIATAAPGLAVAWWAAFGWPHEDR